MSIIASWLLRGGAMALLAMQLLSSADAALRVTYVGNASLGNYRNTSFFKPLDSDGDQVFGTAGYIMYATDTTNLSTSGSIITADPLTYASGVRKTLVSLPPWISLLNDGQNQVACCHPGYQFIDDPTDKPGPLVGKRRLGLALRSIAFNTEASLVDIKFLAGAPAAGVRVGVSCAMSGADTMEILKLTNNVSAGATALQAVGSGHGLYFFDITGAQPNDTVTLRLRKNSGTGGSANVVYAGITFDFLANPLVVAQPTSETRFTEGEPVYLALSALPDYPDGPITGAEYYLNGAFLASTNGPFGITTTNVVLGTNIVYVVATDSIGRRRYSAPVSFLVLRPGLTLLAPGEGTVFRQNSIVQMLAQAMPPSGAVTNVEFFVDGAKVAHDAAAPFSATWSGGTAGPHQITATGRADSGAVWESQSVNVFVAFTLVASNSVWKYLDNGSNPLGWMLSAYNDGGWPSGPAELGFGEADQATVTSSAPITTYFRRSFMASNIAAFGSLVLTLKYDDGGAVYLNGAELHRTSNLPAGAGYQALTTGTAVENVVETVEVSAASLVEGVNVIAAEIHQQAVASSDLSFNLELLGLPAPFDADGDGMPGVWEVENGLDPRNAEDAAGDRDGDGQSNLSEFWAGTNPNDPLSSLRITSVVRAPGTNELELMFRAVSNRTYTVTAKDALEDSAWAPVLSIPAAAFSGLIKTNLKVSPGERYFRVATP